MTVILPRQGWGYGGGDGLPLNSPTEEGGTPATGIPVIQSTVVVEFSTTTIQAILTQDAAPLSSSSEGIPTNSSIPTFVATAADAATTTRVVVSTVSSPETPGPSPTPSEHSDSKIATIVAIISVVGFAGLVVLLLMRRVQRKKRKFGRGNVPASPEFPEGNKRAGPEPIGNSGAQSSPLPLEYRNLAYRDNTTVYSEEAPRNIHGVADTTHSDLPHDTFSINANVGMPPTEHERVSTRQLSALDAGQIAVSPPGAWIRTPTTVLSEAVPGYPPSPAPPCYRNRTPVKLGRAS